jgi:Ca2+-binding RTX toxin-like protein
MGGDGNDFIDGQQGNDTILLGAGDDTVQWDPGDGSDKVEGGTGADTMLFNGSAGSEAFTLSANGQRTQLTRNLGSIVMDINDVETITINALAGTDTVTIDNLAGTDVTTVNVNLAGTIGGAAGDAAPDTVVVNATGGNDIVDVLGAGASVSVIGLPATVNVTGSEGANDHLLVAGGNGNDKLTATTLAAGVVQLTLDGGDGNDTLLGSQGADMLIGGDGNDVIFGDNGNDTLVMGAGNDVVQWAPGDGNDTVEGGDGFDALQFTGANIGETFDIVASNGRALLFRDVASITMDTDGVETIEVKALDGADTFNVGDLGGTDVVKVDIDLQGSNGGGDGAVDSVTVNGTQGADAIEVAGDGNGLQVSGLHTTTGISFNEAHDKLTLNGLGGDDVIDASKLAAGKVMLAINGGLGNDTMFGSEGDDLITGGDGNDVALMGFGDDTFVWNPGDDNDTVEGQGGFDTLLFSGANVSENITISANGDRVLFTRDIASVTMDLDDVEQIDFQAKGGSDTITVNDMTGTDLAEVNIDLSATPGGGGDGAVDTIVINATSGDDVVIVAGDNGMLSVLGLSTQVNIFNFEAHDKLIINTLGGDDVIEASSLFAGISITGNGGEGDDVLLGGEGADVLNGDAGDDVLIGGLGIDILNGGTGDNILIQ